MPMTGNTLVFDVGKTHTRLVVVGPGDEILARRSRDNQVIEAPPYPQLDIAATWDWFIASCRELTGKFVIEAVVATTHGSTAALVDPAASPDGLVLPVGDYEFAGFSDLDQQYEPLRADFSRSYSPSLPGGLNVGRQLYWQQIRQPAAFARTRAILLFPQYWAWRLSGQFVTEVTSLGCHSDLWLPAAGEFSSLATRQGWTNLVPPIVPAWQSPGTVTPEVSARTGLPANCRVLPGLHDNNAGLLRYLRAGRRNDAFTLVSTGTWVLSMATGTTLDRLDENRDMLANVDVHGRAVACARFMGGREYAEICRILDVSLTDEVTGADLQANIDAGCFALPDFSGGSGPFGGSPPRIAGDTVRSPALAALYCALMIDVELDLLGATGDILIEGAFLKNRPLCELVARLRKPQAVFLSASGSDVVLGGALTARGADNVATPALQECEASPVNGLMNYRDAWRRQLRADQE